MKFGVDIDGVITDTPNAMAKWALEKFGVVVPSPYTWNMGLTEEQLREMFNSEFFHTVEPYYKNLSALQQLKADGHELHLVTARPIETEAATIDWLELHALRPDTITFYPDKALVAIHLGLDRFIEDYTPNANRLAVVMKYVYLINQPYNINDEVASGVLRVNSINEVRARLRLETMGLTMEDAEQLIENEEELIAAVRN